MKCIQCGATATVYCQGNTLCDSCLDDAKLLKSDIRAYNLKKASK
jgi:hypothetical protein